LKLFFIYLNINILRFIKCIIFQKNSKQFLALIKRGRYYRREVILFVLINWIINKSCDDFLMIQIESETIFPISSNQNRDKQMQIFIYIFMLSKDCQSFINFQTKNFRRNLINNTKTNLKQVSKFHHTLSKQDHSQTDHNSGPKYFHKSHCI
jgi:hypothetical protein